MIPGFHVGAMLLHDQAEAILEVARLGYRCVAIRPRPGSLDPRESRFGEQVIRLADSIQRAGVSAVIDTDALFMHDRMAARGPTLVTASDSQAAVARAWIERGMDVAVELGSDLITFCSGQSEGPLEETATEQTLERMAGQLDLLAGMAESKEVRLALRPRNGDAIATVAQFERLGQWLDRPERILLAADVGERLLGHEIPVGDRLSRNLDALACIYLCDHRSGTIGDQRIGQGEVALSRITASLAAQRFSGPAIVRIEGHSQWGFVPAKESLTIFPD